MKIRSASDVVYTTIAWTPFLVLIAACTLFLMSGMVHFEARTWGTEWFLPNAGSVNEFEYYDNAEAQEIYEDF